MKVRSRQVPRPGMFYYKCLVHRVFGDSHGRSKKKKEEEEEAIVVALDIDIA